MDLNDISPSAGRKLALLFEGIRYSSALGAAAAFAYPNYNPYRFSPGEENPVGAPQTAIPYLFRTNDDTVVRIKGCGDSDWLVSGSEADGFFLCNDAAAVAPEPISFVPRPQWMDDTTADGFPLRQAGVSLIGDLAVINIAPGCEYFVADKHNGEAMRCRFCVYGAPNERMDHLGQEIGEVGLPDQTYSRMKEALAAIVSANTARHIYLVGGSMLERAKEGRRYIDVAQQVQSVVQGRVPVTCGSGALLDEHIDVLHREKLVTSICFNLEVWSERLFEMICPGKNRYVGYAAWIAALEKAVSLWGVGHVYSAMVGGIELEPEYALTAESAVDMAVEGAEDLCRRGIIPIYSLYWPLAGRDHPAHMARLRGYFEQLNVRYRAIRRDYDMHIWDGFMCHRCAYMQLECDIDRIPCNASAPLVAS